MSPKVWASDVVTSGILGANAAANTAVMSGAPGPLQLLPTPEHGNGWLKIQQDGGNWVPALPQHNDPYNEIYTVRGGWWSLIDDQLINPLNTESDPAKRQAQIDQDWKTYATMMNEKVKIFHQDTAGKYHTNTHAFYGADAGHLAYGNVTWQGGSRWGEAKLTGHRTTDPWQATALDPSEISTTRTVATPVQGPGWKKGVNQGYTISDPDEAGDGTVPQRSGMAPERHVRSLLQVVCGHEPAYRECEPAKHFTLRAIVKIAQAVKGTAMAYPDL